MGKFFGISSIIALTAVPVILWLRIEPLALRFGGPDLFLISLGRLAALTGIVLFSLNLMLSARSRVGALAFILLLFHPLLLVSRALEISLAAAAGFLLPEGYLAKDLGIYALSLMIILLILTFFVSVRYETWKNSHRFMGLAFFLGALHAFMIPSDISRDTTLRYYILFVVSLGGASFVYRTVFGFWTDRKFEYEVIGKKTLLDNIIEFTLKARKRAMEYRPGQFVFASFKVRGLPRQSHPFSISSDKSGNEFKLTIKNLGDYTGRLHEVKTGDLVTIEGPFGRFGYENLRNKKQVWIGAGIGVTPFIGMIEKLAKDPDKDYKVDFYYCTRNAKEQEIIGNLVGRAEKTGGFSFIPHYSDEYGRINAGFISSRTKDAKERDFLVCGPPALMRSLRSQLNGIGITNGRIHMEEFNLN